jgi:DNA-binding transcriptional LysR family regulator
MDFRQLRYFVVVAQERNFTRAAEILHIAQPSLSKQIQLMEDDLGTRLIDRTSRPLKLTDPGKVFYERALQLLAGMEQLTSATKKIHSHERQVLSIGFVPSVLYGGLPMLVRRMRERRPALEIQLIEMMSLEQIEAVKTGRIDLGFGRIRTGDTGVTRMLLREERLILAMLKDHPLASSSLPLPISEITGQELIVYPKETRPSFADQVLSILRDHDARPAGIREVRELQTAVGLVAAGAGVCVIPAAARFLRSDLHYRMLDDDHATSPIIMTHRLNENSEALQLMKLLIRELYAESPPWLDASYNKVHSPR